VAAGPGGHTLTIETPVPPDPGAGQRAERASAPSKPARATSGRLRPVVAQRGIAPRDRGTTARQATPPLTTAKVALVSEATTPDSSPPIWFDALIKRVDGGHASRELVLEWTADRVQTHHHADLVGGADRGVGQDRQRAASGTGEGDRRQTKKPPPTPARPCRAATCRQRHHEPRCQQCSRIQRGSQQTVVTRRRMQDVTA